LKPAKYLHTSQGLPSKAALFYSKKYTMPKITMPKIVIAPDSFKGTLTASQAAIALATGLQQALPDASIIQCPLADGGEGTLDSLQAVLDGTLHPVAVQNAVNHLQTAPVYCCEIQGQSAAVVEVATVVGITDRAALQHPVQKRTTLGLGQLLRWSLDQRVRHIYVGLGGSSTNDGGAGLLVGLGAMLQDADGNTLAPTPAGLAQLAKVDFSGLDRRVFDSKIVLLSDVDSPLCGPQGATHTFGLQKGLTDSAERDRIDQSLAHFATLADQALLQRFPNRSIPGTHTRPGTGAAGGLGFALQLLGGTYTSGATLIAEMLHLPELLQDADWLITGEGCSDRQTLAGKAPWVAAQMAHAQGIPVTVLSGAIVPGDLAQLETLFQGSCFSLAPGTSCCFSDSEAPVSVEECKTNAADWMTKAGLALGRRWSKDSRAGF
jgi:glycerate 2-kinase